MAAHPPQPPSKHRYAHKIDVAKIYPCPVCQKGQIRPITLMDALGCSHCQQIFATTSDGMEIEHLAMSYATRKSWYWEGQRWVSTYERDRTQVVLSRGAVFCTIGLAAGAILAGLFGFPLRWIFILAVTSVFALWLILVALPNR
ncbi:hypothetical protein [Synechococcus sp. PCC 7336]|uniref:hypothetical protein n=1 Tax=Synechococcus sp. PCC 7336 TaxID=195250 RepID=UPI00034812EC|nr:hypothetical protein [Synechococcus sp. PCC 7336]